MEGSAMNRVPSEEDFAHAKRKMAERDRNLDLVCSNVRRRFVDSTQFHNIYILWQRDVDFRAYVFFKRDKDIEACRASGFVSKIEDCVLEELEKAGRGNVGEKLVAFEYDSDENVDRNFHGDYLLRLR